MRASHLDAKCALRDAILTALSSGSEREAMSDIITRRDNPFLNPAPQREHEEREEEQAETGSATPNREKDDLAQRRTQSRPHPHREGPTKFIAAHMSQADMQKWERLKMTELRCPTHAV